MCLDRETEVLFEELQRNGFGRHAAAHVVEGETGSVAMRWLAGLFARWS